MVIKRNGLLGFWWVCGESVNEEEEGFGRAWKRNLGLASSSKNSIVGQRSRSRHLPQTFFIILLLMIKCLGFILYSSTLFIYLFFKWRLRGSQDILKLKFGTWIHFFVYLGLSFGLNLDFYYASKLKILLKVGWSLTYLSKNMIFNLREYSIN